jgi:hypothetical protein
MKALFEFIQLPLSLPINPVWDLVICLILNEVAYKMAFSLAGRNGVTSNERFFIHWSVRVPLFFLMWILFCMGIYVFRFVQQNLIWVVLIGATILCTFLVLRCWAKKHKENACQKKKMAEEEGLLKKEA